MIVGSSPDASFSMSPNGGPLLPGNTIGNFGCTGAMIGYVNCTDQANSITWQIATNHVDTTAFPGSPRVLAAAGAATSDWSLATNVYSAGDGKTFSPEVTISNTSGVPLECSGAVTVIRQN